MERELRGNVQFLAHFDSGIASRLEGGHGPPRYDSSCLDSIRLEEDHARDREAEVRRRGRMGLPPLPGRDAAGRVAAPDGGPMGLSESAQES